MEGGEKDSVPIRNLAKPERSKRNLPKNGILHAVWNSEGGVI
jgi:hypothetical protein